MPLSVDLMVARAAVLGTLPIPRVDQVPVQTLAAFLAQPGESDPELVTDRRVAVRAVGLVARGADEVCA